jgi:hypothetical protein
MNAKVLVVLLAALVGGSLWLAMNRLAPPAPIADAAANDGQATAQAVGAAPVAADTLPTQDAQGAAQAQRTEAAPAGAPAVAANVVVRGRLVDAAGNPRAGAGVGLRTMALRDDEELAFDLDLGAGDFGPKDASATSGDDGRFALALAADRRGALRLPGDALVLRDDAPRVRGDKGDQDLGDVVAIRACVVRGRVQDEAGKPLAGAKASIDAGFSFLGDHRANSAADGSFAVGGLKPGKCALRVGLAGHLPHLVEFELQPEEQRGDVVVTLRTGKAIAGRVVDERGVGVASTKVGTKRREARGGLDIERFAPDEATTTDANGWFTLTGLADDIVSVSAFGKDHTTATAADVAVGANDVLLRVERLGAIEGVLVGADGAPIAGSEVQLGPPSDSGLIAIGGEELDGDIGPMRRTRPARSGADGGFRLEGVKPGKFTVSASGKGHRPTRADNVQVVAAQTTTGVRLVADRGAVARVRVVDAAGAPVAGAKVRVAKPERRDAMTLDGGGNFEVSMRASAVSIGDGGDVEILGGGPFASGTTDADGRCELSGLPVGDAEFTASHKDHAPAKPVTVALTNGGVDVALALRVPGFVAVTVVGIDGKPVAEAEVMLAPESSNAEGGGRRKLVTGVDGKATSPALPPGEYSAVLARSAKSRTVGAGGNRMVFVGGEPDVLDESRVAVVVAAGATVEATLRQPLLARVHGVVTGADGPVAGCVVELLRSGEFAVPGLGSGGPSTTSGDDGMFAFEGVESGEYTLAFGRAQAIVKAEQPCLVPAGVADVRQDLQLRTGVVRVRALDEATGKPVVGVDVEIRRHENVVGGARTTRTAMVVGLAMADGADDGAGMTTMTFGAQKTRTDEQGVAVFEDVPVGEWKLELKHKSHAPADVGPVVVAERQTADAGDARLTAAGSVRGSVAGADGAAVRMAMVERRRVGETDWSEPVMAMGGKFRMPGLAAGRYELRARSVGIDNSDAGPVVEVEVKAGETTQADLRTK